MKKQLANSNWQLAWLSRYQARRRTFGYLPIANCQLLKSPLRDRFNQ